MELSSALHKAIEDYTNASHGGLQVAALIAALEIVSAQTIRTLEPSDHETAMRLAKQFGEHLAELVQDAQLPKGHVVIIKRHEND